MSKRTVPLFLECARPGCGQLKELRKPSERKRHKYCSRRCSALVNNNIRKGFAKGVANSATARKRRVLDRLDGLTVLQAFHFGYHAGLRSKIRQLRKRFTLVKKVAA